MNTLVKKGRKIKGFVFENKGQYFYAFGKPSQMSYLSFQCKSIEHGIECIESSIKDTTEMLNEALNEYKNNKNK